jgi:hypothetical protein
METKQRETWYNTGLREQGGTTEKGQRVRSMPKARFLDSKAREAGAVATELTSSSECLHCLKLGR